MPILAVNSIPHAVLSTLPAIGITDIIGLLLYTGGLAFEVTADRQKDAWVQAKKVRNICLFLGKARHLHREPWLIVDIEEGA
jgi:steroid 5-alpha reductase family enzyme